MEARYCRRCGGRGRPAVERCPWPEHTWGGLSCVMPFLCLQVLKSGLAATSGGGLHDGSRSGPSVVMRCSSEKGCAVPCRCCNGTETAHASWSLRAGFQVSARTLSFCPRCRFRRGVPPERVLSTRLSVSSVRRGCIRRLSGRTGRSESS